MRRTQKAHSNRSLVICTCVTTFLAGCLVMQLSYFLISAAGIALLLLGSRLSQRGLENLDLRVDAPSHAFEGDSVLLEMTLENSGPQTPSFMQIEYHFGPSMVDLQLLFDPRPLPPATRRTLRTHASCSRRWGSYRVGPFVVHRADPMALSTSTLSFRHQEQFSLFPQVYEIPKNFDFGGRATFAQASQQRDRAGNSDLSMGIREYRSGDDRRRVHWRATAHRGTLMVKEVEQDLTPLFSLFLDLAQDHRAGTGRKSTLEFVMRTGACLLWSATQRRQHIQVFADDGQPLEVSPGCGSVHLTFALQQMLGVQQQGHRPLTDLAIEKLPLLPAGSALALVYATATPDVGGLTELLRLLRGRRLRGSFVFICGHSFAQVSRWPVSEEEAIARIEAIRALFAREGIDALFLDSDQQLNEVLPEWSDSP